MEQALLAVGMGIFLFLILNGPQQVVRIIMDGKVKVAEANARAEEAKLEQKKLDREREQH